jgi:hypothetical protein
MMSDDPVCDHCGVGGPTFTAADLEAAFRLGLEMAATAVMVARERVIHSGQAGYISGVCEGHNRSESAVRDLTPPADLAARVEEARK